MDFMEAAEPFAINDTNIEIPTDGDCMEIYECMKQFVIDCNLKATVDPERIKAKLGEYRILRIDGRIASFDKITPVLENAMKIDCVFTREEYRGKGYAKQVVASTMNEILAKGKTATLNVDRSNQISNRLYKSLGFKKVFSQSEYRQ